MTDTAEPALARLAEARTAIDDAQFLFEGGRSTQSVVNRAYYAMFYAALALLETTGKLSSKHTGVISLFDTEFVLKGVFPKDLSKDFHRAFQLRQLSDYLGSSACSREKASETLQKAVRFVEAVAAYLEGAAGERR